MGTQQELIDLERAAWQALSTEGAAAPFYADVLADEVLMLLPGGMVIDDRDAVIESMGGDPWSSYDVRDERVVELSPTSAVLAYRARATRGEMTYEALFSSTYALGRDGRWRLTLHQQTPV